MKGERILSFVSEATLLALEGYTLIAWCRDAVDVVCGPGHLWGLWRPADGKGWYRSGTYWPSHRLNDSRMSRTSAIAMYRRHCRNPTYDWHYMETEAQAFPEKRRQYLRPPRFSRRRGTAMA
jgi:hypothetical protein